MRWPREWLASRQNTSNASATTIAFTLVGIWLKIIPQSTAGHASRVILFIASPNPPVDCGASTKITW